MLEDNAHPARRSGQYIHDSASRQPQEKANYKGRDGPSIKKRQPILATGLAPIQHKHGRDGCAGNVVARAHPVALGEGRVGAAGVKVVERLLEVVGRELGLYLGTIRVLDSELGLGREIVLVLELEEVDALGAECAYQIRRAAVERERRRRRRCGE